MLAPKSTLTFCRPPTIGNYLTNYKNIATGSNKSRQDFGSYPCDGCGLCGNHGRLANMVLTTKTVPLQDGKDIPIKSYINCKNNGIYAARCKKCFKFYVGQTKNPFSTRWNTHRHNWKQMIRQGNNVSIAPKTDQWKEQNALFLHYSREHRENCQETLLLSDAYEVVFIENTKPSMLDIREHHWMVRLNATINIAKTYLPKYKWRPINNVWSKWWGCQVVSTAMMYGVVLMAAMIYCWTVVTAQRYAVIVDTMRGIWPLRWRCVAYGHCYDEYVTWDHNDDGKLTAAVIAIVMAKRYIWPLQCVAMNIVMTTPRLMATMMAMCGIRPLRWKCVAYGHCYYKSVGLDHKDDDGRQDRCNGHSDAWTWHMATTMAVLGIRPPWWLCVAYGHSYDEYVALNNYDDDSGRHTAAGMATVMARPEIRPLWWQYETNGHYDGNAWHIAAVMSGQWFWTTMMMMGGTRRRCDGHSDGRTGRTATMMAMCGIRPLWWQYMTFDYFDGETWHTATMMKRCGIGQHDDMATTMTRHGVATKPGWSVWTQWRW